MISFDGKSIAEIIAEAGTILDEQNVPEENRWLGHINENGDFVLLKSLPAGKDQRHDKNS